MQDKIADILVGHCFMPPDHDNEPADMELAMAEQVAKQIRQQIGREICEQLDIDWTDCEKRIREICQLEEDNEER